MADHPEPRAADAAGPHDGVGPHESVDDHGDDGGHGDHAHAEEPLGPIDVQSWSAAAGGVLLGLLVVLALIQALG